MTGEAQGSTEAGSGQSVIDCFGSRVDSMDNNNSNNTPDKDETGEIMSWVIIFILMVAFWPIGLLLLLKKLNVFSKTSQKTSKQENKAYKKTDNSSQRAWTQYNEAAREAEGVAREVASDIAHAAREVGNAARQAITEVYSDLSQEFSKNTSSQAKTWQSATSQSRSWQSLASNPEPWQSTASNSQSRQSRPADFTAAQSGTNRVSTHQTVTTQSDAQWGGGYQSQKAKAKVKKERTALEKKSGKSVSVILLLIAIALFILGANTIAGAARDIWINGLNRWPDLFLGVFYSVGGFISFFSRNISVKRLARYKRYHVFVSERSIVPLSEITRAAGLPARIVMRDIQAMINEGYLDRDAYIDKELDCLVLSAGAADELRRSAGDTGETPQQADITKPKNRFMAIISELREISSGISDVSIYEKTTRIEDLTARIFRIVEENPDKLPQIRRFMDYYLPTTMKLLKSYATLEKQDIQGENITTTKESIERILDTLVKGYEQQLDQLFKTDAIDIAADINVLENLMQQDGLTGDKPELKTMESN